MPKAIWNDVVLADSETTEVVEGNHYFPPSSVNREHLEASERTSGCPWKGTANYLTVVVGGERNEDAAWFYVDPKAKAANIKDHVAFWKGVKVED